MKETGSIPVRTSTRKYNEKVIFIYKSIDIVYDYFNYLTF